MDDASIQPMLEAAKSFDRAKYGFSPIPTEAKVRLESRPRKRYDAMLHIYAKTSRTIAFKKRGDDYVWIGEQEIFQGPNKYKSIDGVFYESIVLTYDIETVSGCPTNQLNISYWGEDPRLSRQSNLALEDVKPILEEWGY
jgi:hypothetical protein